MAAMRVFFAPLRLWLWALCLAWGVSFSASALSPSHDNPFASWLDTTGTANVATVQKREAWEPFSGWKGWGYGPEPVWIRVQVPAASGPDAPPNILIVRPAYLDQIIFYDPATHTEKRAGDSLPPAEDALHSALYTFAVPALESVRYVYLRVQSTTTRVVNLSLMPLAAAQAFTRQQEWIAGGIWVLSLVFLIWALVQWGFTRERVLGYFAAKQIFITTWGFLSLGFARLTVGAWLPEGVLSLISNVVVAGTIGTIFLFYAALLADYKARPWMLIVTRLAGWAAISLALLNFADQSRLSLQILNSVGPFVLLWIVLTLLFAKSEGAKPVIPKAVMLVYVSLYGALNSVPALMHTGLIRESQFWLLASTLGMLVVDGLAMLVILTVRQHRFTAQHQAVATQLMLQQEQAKLDQQYLEEQRKLMAMLAHEMKTPLANLRIWMEAGPEGRPVMERAIRDMNQVIDRCVQTGQLSDQHLQARNEWFDAAELTQNVLTSSSQPGRVALLVPDKGCGLFADAQMLSIVLANLLENAYKYSAPETPIDMRLHARPGPQGEAGWCWCVENASGSAGLPDPDKVFDKYYRSAHAQRHSGSGLGLFLVKSLMALMHGQVIYTPLQERVRFEVWLPRTQAQAQASEPPSPSSGLPLQDPTRSG